MSYSVTLAEAQTTIGDTPAVDLGRIVDDGTFVLTRPNGVSGTLLGSLDGTTYYPVLASSTVQARRLTGAPQFRYVKATIGGTIPSGQVVKTELVVTDAAGGDSPVYSGGTFTLTRE